MTGATHKLSGFDANVKGVPRLTFRARAPSLVSFFQLHHTLSFPSLILRLSFSVLLILTHSFSFILNHSLILCLALSLPLSFSLCLFSVLLSLSPSLILTISLSFSLTLCLFSVLLSLSLSFSLLTRRGKSGVLYEWTSLLTKCPHLKVINQFQPTIRPNPSTRMERG